MKILFRLHLRQRRGSTLKSDEAGRHRSRFRRHNRTSDQALQPKHEPDKGNVTLEKHDGEQEQPDKHYGMEVTNIQTSLEDLGQSLQAPSLSVVPGKVSRERSVLKWSNFILIMTLLVVGSESSI